MRHLALPVSALVALILTLAGPACRAQQAPAPAAPADSPEIQKTVRRLSVLRNRLAQAEAAGPGNKARAFTVDIPIAKLHLEKAELNLQQTRLFLGGDTTRAEQSLDWCSQALALLAAGKVAYDGVVGLQERAYVSPADGSVQPYWVYVPKAKAPKSGWPMLVYLHGYVPDTSKINPWLPGEDFWKLSEEKGFMVLVPYGRRNTDFEGIGEEDVVTAIGEAKRYQPVDPDRVFLGGPSMGGYGVYVIGLHYPDLFAGLVPMCGRSVPYVIEQKYPDQVPPFKKIADESNVPIALCENAKNLPVYLQQGENDMLINPEHSHRMVARWQQLGYNIKYDEWKGHDHYIYWDIKSHTDAYDWAAKQRRVDAPKDVVYTTFSPKYCRAYWVTLLGIEKWGKPAHIEAHAGEGNQVTVTASNVTAFRLDLPAKLAQAGTLTITVNGRKETRDGWQPGTPVTVQIVEQPAGLKKTAALCGPVRETFFAPFLLVPGTSGSGETTAKLADNAKRWAVEWQAFADGVPRMKSDAQVTEEDIKRYNLVLFGDRTSNAILAKIADKLPVELDANGYRVGNERTAAKDLGLLMDYPNPLAPDRLVCVYSGEFWGDGLDINHKFDLVPDFILFKNELDSDAFEPSRTPRAVVAGSFDSQWQLSPELTWKP